VAVTKVKFRKNFVWDAEVGVPFMRIFEILFIKQYK